MGIYIKGLDMPREPWHCPCRDGETGYCNLSGKSCYDEIPKSCPLVEVPTPHGRLADCDAIEECLHGVMDCEDKIYALGLLSWAANKRTVIEAEEE